MGCSVSKSGRQQATKEEKKRMEKASRKARWIQQLPGSKRFRRSVVVMSVSSVQAWGHLPDGRKPTKDDATKFSRSMRRAIVGKCEGQHDRQTISLEQALFWGPQSDGEYLPLFRSIPVINRWIRFWRRRGRETEWTESPLQKAVEKLLKVLGWTRTGGWVFESQTAAVVRAFDLGCSLTGIFAKMVHTVRNTWRVYKCVQWLEKDRIDSKISRNVAGPQAGPFPDVLGFVLDGRMDRLRKILDKVDGHAMSVTCGGMWTPATCLRDRPEWNEFRHAWCPYRNGSIAATLEHVLWVCPTFGKWRSVEPQGVMLRKLGWSFTSSLKELERPPICQSD